MIETIVESSILVSERLREVLGISWDCNSGEFVKCGKFKNKGISPEAFITELNNVSHDGIEPFRSVLGEDFRIVGNSGNFSRFIVESYLERFPVPFVISSGEDIHIAFEKYRPGSCMRHPDCREYREFYAKNADRIKVIHWERGSHRLLSSHGSCLMWISKERNGYRDRIYSDGYLPSMNHLLPIRIDRFAVDSLNLQSVSDIWKNSHNRVKLTGFTFHGGLFPYMDTLHYCRLESSGSVTVCNQYMEDSVQCTDCSGTDIESGESGGIICQHCGDRYPEDEIHYTDSGDCYCVSCYPELFTYSEYDGNDYDSDSVCFVELLDSSGRRREISIHQDSLSSDFREYSGEYWDNVEYIHENIAIETNSGEFVASEDCISGEFDSTESDFPVGNVYGWIIPWGSEYAYDSEAIHYWNSGNRRIPVVNPVPHGYFPRGEYNSGEFVKKFGEFLAIVFDSSGDTSRSYSVGIRSPFHPEKPISIPGNFRFRTESEAIHCLKILSDVISRDSLEWTAIKYWNGSPSDGLGNNATSYSYSYLRESIKIVESALSDSQ